MSRPNGNKVWETGNVIEASHLNNIEAFIDSLDNKIDTEKSTLESSINEIKSEIRDARGYGDSATGTLGSRIDDLVMIQDTKPSSANNEIWVRSTGNGVQVPAYEEFEELAENTVHLDAQTIEDSQKAQARTNIGAASAADFNTLKDSQVIRYDAAQSLTDAQKIQARSNIGVASSTDVTTLVGTVNTLKDNQAVRYDVAQNLTEAQKVQARTNIGVTAGAVLYSEEQTLTDAQKGVARGNIEAASTNEVADLKSALDYVTDATATAYGTNFFDPFALIQNKDLGTDGVVVDSVLYDITDFIDVGNNTQFTFKLFDYRGTVSFTVYQYSSNTEASFIKRTGSLPGRLILESTTKYIRFRLEKSTANYINPYKVMAVWGSTMITEFVPYYTAYDRTARGMITGLDKSAFEIKYGAYSGNDANDIDENSRYSCLASSVNNLPSFGSGAYIVDTTFTTSNHNNGIQIAYNLDTGKRYWRNKNSGTWNSNWIEAVDQYARDSISETKEKTVEIKYGAYSGTDANDIDENSRYSCLGSGVSHLPSNTGAYIVETNFTTTNHRNGFQIAYRLSDGQRYWRNKNGGTWSDDWVTWDFQNSGMRPKYIALGDSIMYGSVWTQELVDQGTNWYRANVENRIPTRIAHAVGADDNFVNASVSGAYFVGNGSNTILAQIQSANITDAQLITIAGGRNDSSTTFGSVSSTSGDGTLCGAIREVIEYIQENAPKCQIVMIQVTPNARTNSEVFTRTFSGGWSLNSYKEVVSQICAEYCVPFVDWEGCSLFKNWTTFTSAGNNNAHPSSEDVYCQMGNYIAGKVSAVYRG